MKCDNYMEELISAWLDGELEQEQAETVERHLGECADCREHMEILKELREELRACAVHMPAPEGFSGTVMARIAEQQRGRRETVVANWKRGIAAAAATVLIAFGSYGFVIQSGLNAGARVADNTGPKQVVEAPHNNKAAVPNEMAVPVEEPGEKPAGNSGVVKTGNSDTVNNKETSNRPQQEQANNGVRQPAEPREATATAAAGEKTPELVALLSIEKQRVIKSTLIKTRVEDMDTAGEQLKSLAGEYNANMRLVDSRDTAAGRLLAYELTVDRNKAEQLVSGLEKLGTVTVKDENNQDITSQYNKQVELYQSLEAQLKSSDNTEEQETIKARMNEIEQQLKQWDHQSGKHKIVIWLES